ncbi:hypothetical protein BDQ17DRAFT_1433504 [Cyathus striatus]|nr:hypothetical protein BDQ17DRAFT_1433504 [Cyathus striatus]
MSFSIVASRFPLEILELIIDEASLLEEEEYGRTTLRSFSLVCKDLVKPAQRHLLHSVCVRWPVSHPEQLYDTLTSSPEIALFIRELLVEEHTSYPFIFNKFTFHDLLGMLRNLTKLELIFYSMHYKWNDISPDMEQALIFLSHSLKHLILKNISLPPFSAKWIACIPTVRLDRVSWESGQPDPSQERQPHIEHRYNLRSLCIQGQRLPTMQPLLDIISSPTVNWRI